MVSAVQQRGGMYCWGSVRERLKTLLRQEWHMRWQHLSLAVLLTGVLGSLQRTHTVVRSACFSGCIARAGGAAKSAAKKLERFAEEPRLYDDAACGLLNDEAGLEAM